MREAQAPAGTNVVEQLLLGPLARMFGRPNLTAIAIGILSFAVMWWLQVGGLKAALDWWFHPQIPGEVQAWFRNSPFWLIYGYALYVVPGFLAGLIAFRKGFMHGLIVGTAAPFVSLASGVASGVAYPIDHAIWSSVASWPYCWALSGAGGAAADLLRVLVTRFKGANRAA